MRRILLAATTAMGLGLAAGQAVAVPVTTTSDIDVLTNALLAPNSGITITSKSLVSGSATQQGTFAGLNLAPSTGVGQTVSLNSGVALSSGNANIGSANTQNQTSINSGSIGYAALTTLAGFNTTNANVLEYDFTVAPGTNAITLKFVFATEEFPSQSVTDIFGVFVDGVNYAKFPGGELISNTANNPTNFISNPVGQGLYATQYNGFTQAFTLTGLLNTNLTTHTLAIAIADTSDNLFDSGAFISGLAATNSTGGGGIGEPVPVPEPFSLALFGTALLGLGMTRRRRA